MFSIVIPYCEITTISDIADPIADEKSLLLAELRQNVTAGEEWLPALLATIGRWQLPEEKVDGCSYRYLIGGEAFDWLLLAERLCTNLSELVPETEREALLFQGLPPRPIGETEFRRLIGPAKYRAHLNFVYGVLVENGLQMIVTEEAQKERLPSTWNSNQTLKDEVYSRIYSATRVELAKRFNSEQDADTKQDLALDDMREFTYWLFKYRLNQCDPARIASDTRKGLSVLSRSQATSRHTPWTDE